MMLKLRQHSPCPAALPCSGPSSRGFTLVEALLSSLILAIGAVVIGGLCQRCVINNARGWEYEQAYRLLDETLDTLSSRDIARMAREQYHQGDFGRRFPEFRYELDIASQNKPGLYNVTAKVLWDVMGQGYSVQAETLLYQPPASGHPAP